MAPLAAAAWSGNESPVPRADHGLSLRGAPATDMEFGHRFLRQALAVPVTYGGIQLAPMAGRAGGIRAVLGGVVGSLGRRQCGRWLREEQATPPLAVDVVSGRRFATRSRCVQVRSLSVRFRSHVMRAAGGVLATPVALPLCDLSGIGPAGAIRGKTCDWVGWQLR
jgi:hypothetical protein